MNCSDVRAGLPALIHKHLAADEAAHLESHLAGCVDCRRELQALEHVCRLLDAVTAPDVRVDLPRLYQQALELQDRRARRWRRIAFSAGVAAAATLLIAVGLRLEVRVEAHQAVVRWGALPMPEAPAPAPPSGGQPAAVTAEEMRLLSSLIHALAADVDVRDRRQQEALARLLARLQDVQRQSNGRIADAERTVAALYTLQMTLAQKGERP